MELNIKSMTAPERMYTYAQSQQISMQTGLIGYLRADMDGDGKGFFTAWNDFRTDLKTQEFKDEFDDVINTLREDFLKDRTALSEYCNSHPESSFGRDNPGNIREYGARVNTQDYAYLLRLNPNKGEYNLYCYCYKKDRLNRHLHEAERGIRFITPRYKEIFRIPDGDKIRIKTSVGEKLDRTCRYIDEYHAEIGNKFYHICEFAENIANAGNKVIPLRSSLPERCFYVLPSTGELIVLTKGESGYEKSKVILPDEDRKKYADKRNADMGISKAQSEAMLAGSMFGWECPAADPANYDDNGIPIKVRQRDRGDER